MAVTPLKVLLFLAGASGAAGGTAYFAGALDPYLEPLAVANVGGKVPSKADDNAGKPSLAGTTAPAQPLDSAPPAATAKQPADAAAAPPKPAPDQKVATADPAPAKPDASMAAPAPIPPSFDLLRVEPDGSIVIAGRAMPGSSVEIIAGSKVLAKVQAGPSGDFAAVLDEPLKPGDYQIVLRSSGPATVVLNSVETAVVSVPATPGGRVLALVEQPGAPSKLITAPAEKPAAPKPAEQAAAPKATPSSPGQDQAAAPTTTPDASAAQPTTPVQPTMGASKGVYVSVEAVEIEGRKIFVAGAAPAGATVRVYANELLLGDAKSSPEGRFLIETERDLKVGDYIIRADVLAKDGAKVLARAAVPFEREPGESVAAVASPASPPAAASEPPKPAAEPAKQAPDVAPGVAVKSAPSSDNVAAAAPEGAGAADKQARTVAPSVKSSDDAAANSDSKPAPLASEEPAKPADVVTADPAKPADAAAPAPETATANPISPKPAGQVLAFTTPPGLAPKLQPATSGVIIRRGNSLWRISKRVYGRGTRYSTIYVANKEQISDPDRIWPGQIFRVPEKSDRGEDADMKAIGGQATTVQ